MKDPEQMTKHELVQTIYKLSGIHEELLEGLEKIADEKFHKKCYEAENVKSVFANIYHIFREIAKQALAKYKESK